MWLLVVEWGCLELIEMREIVLDPELRAGFFDKSFYCSPARERLIAIELKTRGFVRVTFFLIVIQISGQQDRPRLCKLQIRHLMPGRVPVRSLDDHRAVAEHVIILPIKPFGLAVFPPSV